MGDSLQMHTHIRVELRESARKSTCSHDEHSCIPQVATVAVCACGVFIRFFDERINNEPLFGAGLIERLTRSNITVSG